jgi:hypothetical protein
MAFHKALKECNVLRSNSLACQVPDSIMGRGLGLLIWMVSVIQMHLLGVLGLEETGRQVTYLAGVVHGSGWSSVSRKSNRLCLHVLSYGDSRWPGWTSPMCQIRLRRNPSKLKLHIEFRFPHVHDPYGFLTSGRSQAPTCVSRGMYRWGADEATTVALLQDQAAACSPLREDQFVVRSCHSEIRKRVLG